MKVTSLVNGKIASKFHFNSSGVLLGRRARVFGTAVHWFVYNFLPLLPPSNLEDYLCSLKQAGHELWKPIYKPMYTIENNTKIYR